MNGQDIINLLRQGNYVEVLKKLEALLLSYTKMYNDGQISKKSLESHDWTSILMHEMLTSDLKKEDIAHFTFFFACLKEKELTQPKLLTDLAYAVSYSLAVKDKNDPDLMSTYTSPQLNTHAAVTHFLDDVQSKPLPQDEATLIETSMLDTETLTPESAALKANNDYNGAVQKSMTKLNNMKSLKDAASEYQMDLRRQLNELIDEVYTDEDNLSHDGNHLEFMKQHEDYITLVRHAENTKDEIHFITHAKPEILETEITNQATKLKFPAGEETTKYQKYPKIHDVGRYSKLSGHDRSYFERHLMEGKFKVKEECTQAGIAYLCLHPKVGPKAYKLLKRINAVATLKKNLDQYSLIDERVNTHIREAIVICKQNQHQPSWSERKFLDKLSDFLTLGIKPLVRTLFSKPEENQNLKNIQQYSNPARTPGRRHE